MLHHGHTTQFNEVLKKSVSAYAPKHKHYNKTKSSMARFGVSAAIQISGYYELWTQSYGKLTLTFDNFVSVALTTIVKYKKGKGKEQGLKKKKE